MRDTKARFLLVIALVLVSITPACPVLAQGLFAPWTIWPTYHHDPFHTGQNVNSKDTKDPSTIKAVWAFPRTDAGTDRPEETDLIVDDNDPLNFSAVGNYSIVNNDNSAYNGTYHVMNGVYNPSGKVSHFDWLFNDAKLPHGKYQVFVWVPADKSTATNTAVYTVSDDYGSRQFVFNQASAAGTWQPISNNFFTFTGLRAKEGVSLTAEVETQGQNGKKVIGDAVKFVPATAQEIYSSPASANIRCTLYDPDDPTVEIYDEVDTCVYTGTVELGPGGASGAFNRDKGAIYCIYGITPTTINPAQPDGTPNPSIPDSDRLVKISKYLGTPKWRYPRNGALTNSRLPVEGPISGGVFSSPTLAFMAMPDGDPPKLVCYVAGMDRQLYALDAETGDLLWKGPGFTAGEESDPAVVTSGSAWQQTKDREDAFGGQFHYVPCAETPDNTCTWLFTQSDQQNVVGMSGAQGLSYSIFAWIPDAGGTGTKTRSRNATYTITYYDPRGTGDLAEADITINQSDSRTMGTWVKIGSSYFSPTKVVLKNTAAANPPADPANPDPGDDKPSNYCVVADALMFVPDTVNGMGYSTPITDAVTPPGGGDAIATHVYQATENGRVLSFMVTPMASKVGKIDWIYPAVRTQRQPTPEQMDQPDLGDIGASPAYKDNKLYVAGMNGVLHCITASTGEEEWTFSTGGSATTGEGGGGFSSSPTLDNTNIYIGSTGGHFYCLNMDGSVKWEYPSDANDPPDNPLGAFRYSTPAVATDSAGQKRVWCASADGRIYCWRAATGERFYVDDGGTPYPTGTAQIYDEPSFGTPVQGSVAIDGPGLGGQHLIMYVGDLGDRQGTLHWRDAETGEVPNYFGNYGNIDPTTGLPYETYEGWTAPGMLFSSPNITDIKVDTTPVTWIYIGCADGHLIAFTKKGGGWGGEWQGGDWPFAGDQYDQNAQKTTAAPDTQVQFDVFTEPFFNDTLGFDPEPDPTTFDPGKWPDNVIVSKEMKLPTKTDPTLIDQYLTDQAKLQRTQNFLAPSRLSLDAKSTVGGVVSDTVFYEWGEKIYAILWNLPAQEMLEGSNIIDKVRLRMTNQSCGESAGATSSGQSGNIDGLVVQVRALKDYTVLKGSTGGSGGGTTYGPCTDINGDPVRRSYALISIDIDGSANRRRPPSPGPGWAIYVDLDKRTSKTVPAGGGSPTYGPTIRETIPLAKLRQGKSGGYEVVRLDRVVNGKVVPGQAREAALGINNPLAIRDDGIKDTAGNGDIRIAWTANYATAWNPNRYDPDVHLNGNNRWQATKDDSGRYNFVRLNNPLIYLDQVVHGTSSREAPMGVADRSAMGMQRRQIGTFRIEERDLSFRGDLAAIECPTSVPGVKWGFRFPWDQGIGSIDYPHIYTRYQSFQLVSTDLDPADKATPLLAIVPAKNGVYEESFVQPDTVLVSVDVPRFQPANTSADSAGYTAGYSRSMNAYIDSNNDGNLDSGNTSRGRPTTWQEVYRTFRVGLKVPPDPKIEVDEQLIDIGRAPHGLGQNLAGGLTFTAFNKNPLIQQWFKQITIKNAGNVNLYNIRLNQLLGLYGDQASPSQQLPGLAITSSLDVTVPPGPFSVFGADPFICSSANDAGGSPRFLGYTLSKPRVGDADPTVMTIPDRRRWNVMYPDKQAASGILNSFLWNDTEPLPVLVSVQVPLTQPVGTYQSWDPNYNVPYIAVFSNLAKGSSWNANAIAPSDGDPVAMPSFQLKLAVRENQLTGGLTPTTLPQIDYRLVNGEPAAPSDQLPRWGDATPAAFRDANGLGVHLFWSSNRLNAEPPLGSPDYANAPWFINHTLLGFSPGAGNNSGRWLSDGPNRWWGFPAPSPMPASQWTIPSGGSAPAGLVKFQGGSNPLYAVKHYSPSIAENQARGAAATANRTWLTWAGTADFQDPNGKIRQENLVFYTDITQNPDPARAGSPPAIYAILHDPSMQKRYPAALSDGNNMWMFWQGGNAGNWSIYYTHSEGGPAFANTEAADIWKQDAKLRTPDSLAAVGSPNPILRHLWADLRGASSNDFTDPFLAQYNNAQKMIDVVYAGTNKVTRNSDIMLSRYDNASSVTSSRSPARSAQPLPRVYNEKLVRDSKLGFYTSQHIAWVRLRAGQAGVADQWGTYVGSNLPFIHVVFPKAYADGLFSLPAGTVISATDGSVVNPSGVVTPPASITPEIDSSSGVYTYSYPQGSVAEQALGKMIVDFSSGIIRFQKPFKETPVTVNGVTSFTAPEVHADYTPQAWRITTDAAVDGSPRAFIERTSMCDPNESQQAGNPRMTPGLEPRSSWPSDKPAPVDRLWVFWRKTGASIENSTIFYTTMRVGVDLTKLPGYQGPIPMNPLTGMIGNADVPNPNVTINALGPWEVDRTGTKIYFSEVDERYQSMPSFLGNPGPITISYTYGNGAGKTASFAVPDVSWITELPEQSLGPMMDANVNEGSIYAFADPHPQESGTSANVRSSKIWVFWTSTRGGNSDLFWETLSPNFWGR